MTGVYAMGIGWLFGKMNNPDNLNTTLNIGTSSMDTLKNAWKASNEKINFWEPGSDKRQVIKQYAHNVLDMAQGLVGEKWLKFKEMDKKEISESIADLCQKSGLSRKALNTELEKIAEKSTNLLGASQSIKLEQNGEIVPTTMKMLIKNIYNMQKEFFTKVPSERLESAMENIKSITLKKSFLGIAMTITAGFAIQFLNRQITKMTTGSEAFVGLPDYEKNSKTKGKKHKKGSFELKIAKALSAASMLYLIGSTIAGTVNPVGIGKMLTKSGELAKKLELKGNFPSLNQLRAIYGCTIIGRIMAASDRNELRETNTRDFPGFISWLVLGGLVSKLTGQFISKGTILNGEKAAENSGWFKKMINFIGKRSLKTHSEIKALKFDTEKERQLIGKLNVSLGAGLLYSALALGVMIPLINKYITNKIAKNEKIKNMLARRNLMLARRNLRRASSGRYTSRSQNENLYESFLLNKARLSSGTSLKK
jgi:hypothetical protein